MEQTAVGAVEGAGSGAAGYGLGQVVSYVGGLWNGVADSGAARTFSLTDQILDNPACFVAGTQVVTAIREIDEIPSRDSILPSTSVATVRYITTAIEAIRAGDVVIARDQYAPDAPVTLRRVEEVFQRTAYGLSIVTLRSSTGVEQTLYTTNEHPVYVPGRGWVVCRELQEGDELLEPAGGIAIVIAARYQRHPRGIAVYNFRVAQSHTYFVRENGSTAEPVWVHNAACSTSGENIWAATGREMHGEFSQLAKLDGYITKTPLKNGLIPDAFRISKDGLSAIVRELKPDNPGAVARGLGQLAKYAQQISKQWGIPLANIRQILETY